MNRINPIPALGPQRRARLLVTQYYNLNVVENGDLLISVEDTYIVWYCYVLGGWKALVSTTEADERYYEVTYDKVKKQTYVDVYQKKANFSVPDGEWLLDN